MEKKTKNPSSAKSKKKEPDEKQMREVLSRPPKDRREVTIGPTSKTGPDVIVEPVG